MSDKNKQIVLDIYPDAHGEYDPQFNMGFIWENSWDDGAELLGIGASEESAWADAAYKIENGD